MPIHNNLRLIYRLLSFTIILSFSGDATSSAYAQKTISVADTVIMNDATCPSGFAMDFLDGRFCIDGKPKKIQKHLGSTKVAYSFHKKIKFQGKKFAVYRIESYTPKQAAGTTYETRGGLQSFIEVVGAVSTGVNAANGVYTPPVYVPPATTQTTNGASYANGVNECVTPLYNHIDFEQIYSYKNTCSQKITIRFVALDGAGGSMDVEPGAIVGTGDTPSTMTHRTYNIYACPYGYLANDQNDQYINTPVVRYKCRSRGY